MKQKIFIFMLFILPSIIQCVRESKNFAGSVNLLNRLAEDEETSTINKKIILKQGGFLRDGIIGFFYEGTMIEDNRPVAIRFTRKCHKAECNKEIEMYTYLKAYEDETAATYGIQTIYYHGQWDDYILTAFTLFEMGVQGFILETSPIRLTELDALILLKDFVFQSKWMHSLGIRHDNIQPVNIMIKGHRSFLMGFIHSSKMMEDRGYSTPMYICQRKGLHEIVPWSLFSPKRLAIDDYESFLYTISAIMRRRWFSPKYDNKARISHLNDEGLQKIIKAFAEQVWPSDGKLKEFPDYNYLHDIISQEIIRIMKINHGENISPNCSPKFSWKANEPVTSEEEFLVRDIANITDPNDIDFKNFKYPHIAKGRSFFSIESFKAALL